jgi:hypothetical protein
LTSTFPFPHTAAVPHIAILDRPNFSQTVLVLLQGDRVSYFFLHIHYLLIAFQEIRETENRNTADNIVQHILFRMKIVEWTFRYHEVTGNGRGGGVLRQQLLEGLFQDSLEYGPRFRVEGMDQEARRSEMTRLKDEFKKWKAIHNSTVVKGRSLLHRCYMKVSLLLLSFFPLASLCSSVR